MSDELIDLMAEIPNALTDLLRSKTPDEIYDTLSLEDCLSRAGVEQRAQGIALIREADAKARRHREQGMAGPTREYEIIGALIGGGYLNTRARELLGTITYQPTQTASIAQESDSTDASLRLQTIHPKLRLRVAAFYILCIAFLAYLTYRTHWPYRAFYGGLFALGAAALIVQHRREHALVHNRLSAIGVVTEYKMRGKGAPHFGKGVPVIKYQFVAFDQKTYRGETGWRARGLYEGAKVTILYQPENPAVNHPLTSFIFYSFH